MNKIPSDIENYLASEKYDGVRAFWTGSEFMTRHGKIVNCPDWFKAGMPDVRLDGELWMGRRTFDALQSEMQRKGATWGCVKFMVFDYAILRVPTTARIELLELLELPSHCQLVSHHDASHASLDAMEERIVGIGGEGICLRNKDDHYRPNNFIKVKRLFPDLDRWQG